MVDKPRVVAMLFAINCHSSYADPLFRVHKAIVIDIGEEARAKAQ